MSPSSPASDAPIASPRPAGLRRWLPASLQGRLLLPVITLAAAAWLLAAVLGWRDVNHELEELLDGHLAQAAALLVVQQAGPIDDDELLHLPDLHGQAGKVAFQVFREGRLALHSSNAPTEPLAAAPAAEGRLRTVRVQGSDWRVFVARGQEPGNWVCVGEQLDSRADILQAVLRSALAPMALVLPLLALALAWAIRRGLAPLRQLGQQLAARQPQVMAPVSVDHPPTEMLPTLTALNGLFGRIEALMQAERRFTADASHELRTPVAAIRAQAQAALGATDAAELRHALRSTLAGCDRASRLIEQLLTLARLEGGAAPAHERFDLVALTRSVLADAAPGAHARGQTLGLDAPDTQVATRADGRAGIGTEIGGPIDCHRGAETSAAASPTGGTAASAASRPVWGDPTLLTVLLRNLVDNALRYSPDGAQVQVRLRAVPEGMALCIEDSGPGMDAADRQRLGERFFRVAGSGRPGSGLGWSIVQRIAEAHGARWSVDKSAALGGLAVGLVFPLAKPPPGEPDSLGGPQAVSRVGAERPLR